MKKEPLLLVGLLSHQPLVENTMEIAQKIELPGNTAISSLGI